MEREKADRGRRRATGRIFPNNQVPVSLFSSGVLNLITIQTTTGEGRKGKILCEEEKRRLQAGLEDHST